MVLNYLKVLLLPIRSFFSKRAYREVGYNWKGVNFAYLFLLLAICCVPISMNVREKMIQSLNSNQVAFINQMPEIHIKNGVVNVDQKKPDIIKRKDGSTFMVIDTTGSMNYIDDKSTMAMLTESDLIVRYGPNHFNTFDLSGVKDLNVDKHVLNHWLNLAKSTIAPLSYGIFLMLSFLCAVMTLLCISIIGLVLATALHNPLGFKGALRIASVAATPAIVFITLSATYGTALPPTFAIGFAMGITILYVFIGVLSCSSLGDSKPKEGDAIDLKAVLHEKEGSIEDVAA